MSTLRFSLIRFWVWLLRIISVSNADPADVYFCYRLLLNRDPEAKGWRNQLQMIRRGHDRRALVEKFLTSREYLQLTNRSSLALVDTGRFKIWVDEEDALISRPILIEHAYEPHVTAVLERELVPEAVFVDIGANIGWFTLLAAGRARRVVAIEPNPGNVQLLYRSLLENGFDNVTVLEYAVSGQQNLLRLNFLRSNGYVSNITGTGDTMTIVQGQTLDALVHDLERIDVIKMDIEGHEPVALQGMKVTLARFRPTLVLEFHPQAIETSSGTEPAALLDDLSELGYRMSVIHLDGRVTSPMEPAGVLDEWQQLNRRLGTRGSAHLDLIARQQ